MLRDIDCAPKVVLEGSSLDEIIVTNQHLRHQFLRIEPQIKIDRLCVQYMRLAKTGTGYNFSRNPQLYNSLKKLFVLSCANAVRLLSPDRTKWRECTCWLWLMRVAGRDFAFKRIAACMSLVPI
jgi:hypothetical protein